MENKTHKNSLSEKITQLVYNHFRYSYSKFFDKCNYLHVSKICDRDVNFCNMRCLSIANFIEKIKYVSLESGVLIGT